MNKPSEPIIVPLRLDGKTGATQILLWLFVMNIVVAVISVIVIGGFSVWFGSSWMGDPTMVLVAVVGALLAILAVFGVLYLVVRRRTRVGGSLRVFEDVRLFDAKGEAVATAPLEDFACRTVQLYDNDGSESYPVGPAVELMFPQRKFVIANRNSRVRWNRDVASVLKADWICDDSAWGDLLLALDVDDETIPY